MEDQVSISNPFRKLFQIIVSEYVEKKGQFSYLSWPFAVAQLRLADPTAALCTDRRVCGHRLLPTTQRARHARRIGVRIGIERIVTTASARSWRGILSNWCRCRDLRLLLIVTGLRRLLHRGGSDIGAATGSTGRRTG